VLENSRRDELQSAYQVLVASSPEKLAHDTGDQWDSGKVTSDNSTQVIYAGAALESGRTYYWKVRTWNQQAQASPYSHVATFGVGLLARSDWHGQWIGGGNLLRKGFDLPGKIVRARVYITALGYYELHINGSRIGDNVLDPAWTDYSKRVLYSTYDVTKELQQGKNAVGVMLGGGWATLGDYYKSPALLFQMNTELASGKRIVLSSDASWKTHAGPVVSDSVYDGEVYDARLEQRGWDQPGFEDAAWSPAKEQKGTQGAISAEMMPPIQVVDTLAPQRMTNPEPGVYVYDFGQNFAGWAELRVQGPRGAKVKIRFSELLFPDGRINRQNLRGAKARDIYILDGQGNEVYDPHFTYHGFRYVEVTGYPGTPSLDSLRGRVVHSAVRTTGSFVASKDILNQIQHLIHWGQLSNLYSIPTDCDQRDERMGWMGDAQATVEEAMMNFDMAAFYTNFIRDMRDAQKPDGGIPDTVPQRGDWPTDPVWGSAYPLTCWHMWQQYGDRRVLEENYEGLKKYEKFLQNEAKDNILSKSYYGDWVSLVPTSGALVSDSYYYHDTEILSNVARILGKTEDAEAYGKLADEIKTAFNQKFFDPAQGFYANGSQTSQALPLSFGLVPTKEVGSVISYLGDNDISYEHNTHLTTGFIGAKFLLPALTKYGRPDLAYELATQTTYPSWGYMISHGATTLWEIWQDKTGPSMNSQNHAMFGSIGAWFYRALGGIDLEADSAGYRHIRIDPQIVEDLHWASASLNTVRGRVACDWVHTPGAIAVNVTLPANSDGVVILHKERDMRIENVTVREGDHIVWKKGHYVAGDEGVRSGQETIAENTQAISLKVGSGTYHFRLTAE
jgi:alpha-L-rhamnosidase